MGTVAVGAAEQWQSIWWQSVGTVQAGRATARGCLTADFDGAWGRRERAMMMA